MTTAAPQRRLKIAIASSGLAHIKRGVETWAEDLGNALRANGVDATTFQGSPNPTGPSGNVAPCWRRFDPKTQRLVRILKHLGGWRYGFGSGYDTEQTTFALSLFWRIRSAYDILHVQDPLLALIFDRLNRAGLSRPRVILAHGTEEDTATLQKYSYLQHLAPNYLADWLPLKPARQLAFAIPNFVDLERFRPADKQASRALCGLSSDALVVLSVGALKSGHKRMDYLLKEFATWQRALDQAQPRQVMLVIAGAREADTENILRLAAALPQGSVQIIENAPRTRVAELLRAADIFTLASLHEMMPIAVLEALASGLPIACNDTETLRWMVGEAGTLTDLSQPGALVAQLSVLASPAERAQRSLAARHRAETIFSEPVVIAQILAMYQQVAAAR